MGQTNEGDDNVVMKFAIAPAITTKMAIVTDVLGCTHGISINIVKNQTQLNLDEEGNIQTLPQSDVTALIEKYIETQSTYLPNVPCLILNQSYPLTGNRECLDPKLITDLIQASLQLELTILDTINIPP
uniref:Late endosomal/lysosomal adaptor and MAPK and MTOR activator 5 n=1 Tax=Rhabditophanes sp. KR3021 TaxID=114890 RepID=A0AC35TWC0_9BILA